MEFVLLLVVGIHRDQAARQRRRIFFLTRSVCIMDTKWQGISDGKFVEQQGV